MTVQELLAWGGERIACTALRHAAEGGVPKLEAELLLGNVLGLDRTQLFLLRGQQIGSVEVDRFRALVERRERFEPIAYLLGFKEFYGRQFQVNPAVLIPRPETEQLVDLGLVQIGKCESDYLVVDVGTGSGVIICTLALEVAAKYGPQVVERGRWIGLDLSGGALDTARQNCRLHSLESTVTFVKSDLLSGIPPDCFAARQTIFLANLPYVPESERLSAEVENYEPRSALRAGADGLVIIREFIAQLRGVERTGCQVLLEFGDGQRTELESAIRAEVGWDVTFHKDLAGKDRVAHLVRVGSLP